LVILKAVTGCRDLLQPNARIELLELSCGLERDHALVRNHEQDRDANVAHQLPIVGVRRRQHVESGYLGVQPRIDAQLDELA